MLISFAGLPGTGKTTIARLLAPRLGAVFLRIDTIEGAIRLGHSPPEDLRDMGYRIADHGAPQPQIVLRDPIGDEIAHIPQVLRRRTICGWGAP